MTRKDGTMSGTFPHDYDEFNDEQALAEIDAYERDRAAGKTIEAPGPTQSRPYGIVHP